MKSISGKDETESGEIIKIEKYIKHKEHKEQKEHKEHKERWQSLHISTLPPLLRLGKEGRGHGNGNIPHGHKSSRFR